MHFGASIVLVIAHLALILQLRQSPFNTPAACGGAVHFGYIGSIKIKVLTTK